jgi:hypothetical protein
VKKKQTRVISNVQRPKDLVNKKIKILKTLHIIAQKQKDEFRYNDKKIKSNADNKELSLKHVEIDRKKQKLQLR